MHIPLHSSILLNFF